jgi:hypothetical protein
MIFLQANMFITLANPAKTESKTIVKPAMEKEHGGKIMAIVIAVFFNTAMIATAMDTKETL